MDWIQSLFFRIPTIELNFKDLKELLQEKYRYKFNTEEGKHSEFKEEIIQIHPIQITLNITLASERYSPIRATFKWTNSSKEWIAHIGPVDIREKNIHLPAIPIHPVKQKDIEYLKDLMETHLPETIYFDYQMETSINLPDEIAEARPLLSLHINFEPWSTIEDFPLLIKYANKSFLPFNPWKSTSYIRYKFPPQLREEEKIPKMTLYLRQNMKIKKVYGKK